MNRKERKDYAKVAKTVALLSLDLGHISLRPLCILGVFAVCLW